MESAKVDEIPGEYLLSDADFLKSVRIGRRLALSVNGPLVSSKRCTFVEFILTRMTAEKVKQINDLISLRGDFPYREEEMPILNYLLSCAIKEARKVRLVGF